MHTIELAAAASMRSRFSVSRSARYLAMRCSSIATVVPSSGDGDEGTRPRAFDRLEDLMPQSPASLDSVSPMPWALASILSALKSVYAAVARAGASFSILISAMRKSGFVGARSVGGSCGLMMTCSSMFTLNLDASASAVVLYTDACSRSLSSVLTVSSLVILNRSQATSITICLTVVEVGSSSASVSIVWTMVSLPLVPTNTTCTSGMYVASPTAMMLAAVVSAVVAMSSSAQKSQVCCSKKG